MCDSRQPTDGAGSDARVTCACPYKGQRRVHYEWCEFRASNRRPPKNWVTGEGLTRDELLKGIRAELNKRT